MRYIEKPQTFARIEIYIPGGSEAVIAVYEEVKTSISVA